MEVFYIKGDGIGPEIFDATRPVLDEALRLDNCEPIQWSELLASEKAIAETGSPLPEATIDALKEARFAIKGPLGTPVGSGIRSINVALRHGLDLYACIRPVKYIEGLQTPVKHPERIDMIIFRENTEDVYAGIEFAALTPEARRLVEFLRDSLGVKNISEKAAVGVKPMTEAGSKRLVRKAVNFALDNGRKSVTLVHKGNIMKFTEGAFRQWGYDLASEEFSDKTKRENEEGEGKLILKDRIADAMFQEVLLRPAEYDVIATPNLNGDYLSDALAAQAGGLGLAPGVNMSDNLAFFEATHGTAPGIAGKDIANPGSLLLSGAMLLEHMGYKKAGKRVREGLQKAIKDGKMPADLASQTSGATEAGCREFGEIVGSNL